MAIMKSGWMIPNGICVVPAEVGANVTRYADESGEELRSKLHAELGKSSSQTLSGQSLDSLWVTLALGTRLAERAHNE